MLWFMLGIILFLMMLSAFFSGSETAFTAVSTARLRSKAKDGDEGAIRVLKILERKERMIGALLLGNNAVNILASALATVTFVGLFGEAGVLYATIVMTVLVLIFAEVLPKTYALHHSLTMTQKVSPIIYILIKILSPITEAVTAIVRHTLLLFGADISKVLKGSHLDLLRGVIDQHQGEDNETQTQRAMLRSVLDLADVDVEEIMIHRKNVEMLNIDLPTEDIVAAALKSPFTRLPLYREDHDNIVGVLHAKELLRELQKVNGDASQLEIEDVTLEPWFIPETTTLFDQLQAFQKRRQHFAYVVDEYGAFMGVVTLEDILEEIVGEIDDEHDQSVVGVKRQADGTIVAQGDVTIRDLNREFDWSLPGFEEYSTLAGLVLYEAQTIPDVGQSFMFYGFKFDILKRTRNQITLVRITPPEKEPEED